LLSSFKKSSTKNILRDSSGEVALLPPKSPRKSPRRGSLLKKRGSPRISPREKEKEKEKEKEEYCCSECLQFFVPESENQQISFKLVSLNEKEKRILCQPCIVRIKTKIASNKTFVQPGSDFFNFYYLILL
jgi:hypothetical protein